ncbi:MAG: hypothetical protein WDZ30_02570 [Cellvibrionaceae bacterium]
MTRLDLCRYSFLLLAVLGILCSCSQREPPDSGAASFWTATLTNNEPMIRATVVPDTFVADDFATARHDDLFDSVIIGAVKVENDRAEINTQLQGIFYGEPETVEFNTVAVLYKGKWKVDYAETATEMIGALLGVIFIDIDQSMRDELEALGKSIGESVREDLREDSR